MGCEREQCPAEDAEPDDVEKNADDEHGDGSRDKGCEGRAFHHHHGAALRIVDPVGVWNPLRRGCFCRSALPGRETRGPQSSATLELVPRWSFRPAPFWSRPDRSSERPASVAALTRRCCRISTPGCRASAPCQPGSPECQCRG